MPVKLQGRDHNDFLCTVREMLQCPRKDFVDGLEECVEAAGFEPVPVTLEEVSEVLVQNPTHLKTTKMVDLSSIAAEST